MTAAVYEVNGDAKSGAGGGGGGVPPSGSPVLGCLAAVSGVLAEVAGARCWSMIDAEVTEAVRLALAVRAQADELVMRVVAAAGARDLPGARGATSPAAWLASTERVSRRDAAALVRLGRDLDPAGRRHGRRWRPGTCTPSRRR